jgi:hypothetical protein
MTGYALKRRPLAQRLARSYLDYRRLGMTRVDAVRTALTVATGGGVRNFDR